MKEYLLWLILMIPKLLMATSAVSQFSFGINKFIDTIKLEYRETITIDLNQHFNYLNSTKSVISACKLPNGITTKFSSNCQNGLEFINITNQDGSIYLVKLKGHKFHNSSSPLPQQHNCSITLKDEADNSFTQDFFISVVNISEPWMPASLPMVTFHDGVSKMLPFSSQNFFRPGILYLKTLKKKENEFDLKQDVSYLE